MDDDRNSRSQVIIKRTRVQLYRISLVALVFGQLNKHSGTSHFFYSGLVNLVNLWTAV